MTVTELLSNANILVEEVTENVEAIKVMRLDLFWNVIRTLNSLSMKERFVHPSTFQQENGR